MTTMTKKATNKEKHAFWIWGNQRQCRKAWELLCQRIEEKTGEPPNVETLSCGFNPKFSDSEDRLASAGDVYHLMRSKDMFDDRCRIIRLLGVPENYLALADYMHLVNERNLLVLSAPFDYIKPGTTKQRVSVKTSKFYKLIKNQGLVLDFPLAAGNQAEAIRWVKDVASDYEKKFSEGADAELINLQGLELDVLTNTVEKLATYQRSKIITQEDVSACCGKNFLDEVWTYIRYLDTENHDAAMNHLQNFYQETYVGESFSKKVSNMLGAIRQHFLFLLVAKDACQSTLNARKIEEVSKHLLNKSSQPIFSSRYIQGALNNTALKKAFRWSQKKIYCLLADVHHCMFLCRKQSSNISYQKLCLETFTMVVCGKISVQQAARARGHILHY